MTKWRLSAPWIVVGLAVGIIGTAVYSTHNHDQNLAAARDSTRAAVASYEDARDRAMAFEIQANEAWSLADSVQNARVKAAPARAAVVKAAPKECQPAIDSL